MKTIARYLTIAVLLLPIFAHADGEKRIEIEQSVEPIEERSYLAIDSDIPFHEPNQGKWWGDLPLIYYPASVHWITQISALGNSLELEDGSVWTGETAEALTWKSTDPLFITQNWTWFSSYTFKIINKVTGTLVPVNLKLGPYESSSYTHFISIIDKARGELALSDSSNWQVCPSDTKEFNQWSEDQAIIIGVNSGWQSSFDILLINVNRNKFVRAKQF